MTELQPTIPIAAELRSLSAIAAALSALAESQGKDDIFYLALELSSRLDALGDRHAASLNPTIDSEV